MLNFDILERDLGIVSPQYFVYDFSRKIFIVLFSINWPDFCAWLALLLEILSNMCIAIVYFPGCDDINFEINRTFLIKPFFYMTKKSDKILKILRAKRAFQVKSKAFFIILKGPDFQLPRIVLDLSVRL